MKIENQKVVTAIYEMYIAGENGEEMIEKTTPKAPLVYCQGEGMMLPKFEEAMAGMEAGDKFDFRLPYQDAYGEYDESGLRELDRRMFYNGDGEFDSDRVYVGNIIPMTTVDGQIVNAQVVKVAPTKVTIDLNHPLAGEDLHFVGEVLEVRDVTEGELKAIHHHHCGGGCGGGCNGGCNGDCDGDCDGECEDGCSDCDNHSCSQCGEH
ncbi:MAG: peptidylprolyl isomerase [Paludibacteraceae bacterium]